MFWYLSQIFSGQSLTFAGRDKLCQSEVIVVNLRQYCVTFAEGQETMKLAVEKGIYVGCVTERV